ncbi:hypothetical protein NA57DRAFT_51784 [Rhizodiscina lignyota]|uniref:Uncharacterized protein n=1 Tax=Rhizodiscina lignyota TaxID=1504668 RepID=A0A9P4MBD0_9PEZI|nr:hypothetical protein NA57DRAFT_51784 [Rhizodiscina lignyota]
MRFSIIVTLLYLSGAAMAAPLDRNATASTGTIAQTSNTDSTTKLETTPVAINKFDLVNSGPDQKFDFNATSGATIIRSDRRLSPALVAAGVSMTVGFIGAPVSSLASIAGIIVIVVVGIRVIQLRAVLLRVAEREDCHTL